MGLNKLYHRVRGTTRRWCTVLLSTARVPSVGASILVRDSRVNHIRANVSNNICCIPLPPEVFHFFSHLHVNVVSQSLGHKEARQPKEFECGKELQTTH